MSTGPDLLLYDRENRLVAAVDIRARRGTSQQWAAELRRNLLQHEGYRGAPYFLVVALDRIYLWLHADTAPDLTLPEYEVESEPVFAPLLAGTRLDLRTLGKGTFEMLVSSWLSSLVHSPSGALQGQAWLAESGFLGAVHKGRLYDQAAA